MKKVQPLQDSRNFKYSKIHKREPKGPSLTVPDLSYTIPEILLKFTRGQSLDIERAGAYAFENGEEDFDAVDFRELNKDLTGQDDAKEILESIKRKQEAIRELSKKKANELKTIQKSDTNSTDEQ